MNKLVYLKTPNLPSLIYNVMNEQMYINKFILRIVVNKNKLRII